MNEATYDQMQQALQTAMYTLEFYANRENYSQQQLATGKTEIEDDNGQRARNVLEVFGHDKN